MSASPLAILITIDTIILIVVVCLAAYVVLRHITGEILAAEEREIERRRQAGIQSGFVAGWHGAGVRS